jgi:hypothetical protein
MSATTRSDEEPTPGERMDAAEKDVLYTLIQDPFPWTVAELEREMGRGGGATTAADAVSALDRAGLVHRFIVRRPSAEGVAEKTEVVVIPTRAARRSDELHEGAI